MKTSKVLIVTAAATALIALAVGVYWHVMVGPTEFDRSVWLRMDTKSDSPPRLRMADGLLGSGVLLGKSRTEIETMLGPPASTDYFPDAGMVYWLGPERGYISIDSEWLRLDFDTAGRVRDVRIVRD